MRDHARIIASILITLLLWPSVVVPVAGQDRARIVPFDTEGARRAAFAMTLADYPATPGDVYELTYRPDDLLQSVQFIVEHDYQLQLDLFGSLNVRGLTFAEVRNQVRSRVIGQYRNSYPRLLIVRVGEFQVYLDGEVTQTGWHQVDGLTRLSDVVEQRATEYSSLRRVGVFKDGEERLRYDLFEARRDGRPDQNPYVRPADRIELVRAERQVELSGQVRRPGSYELLPGETLGELIERYGDGTTVGADLGRVLIQRISVPRRTASERFRINAESRDGAATALRDQDRVTVPTREEHLPVVFFEGALRSDGPAAEPAGGVREGGAITENQFARLAYRFEEGELLSEAAAAIREEFRGAADLREAYIIRSEMGGVQAVDLEELLYRGSTRQDVELADGDRIVIPFQQRFVTVTGGVNNPGRFRYVQGRTFEYYLDLAGGTNINQAWSRSPRIRDREGERRRRSEEIQPEDRIHMRRNSPALYLGIAGSMAAAVLTIWVLADPDRSPLYRMLP